MSPHKQHTNLIVFFAVIIVIVFFGGLMMLGLQKPLPPQSAPVASALNYSPTGIAARGQTYLQQDILTIDSPVSFSVGPKDAKVVFVEFSDYQCPYSQIDMPVVRQLMSQYKDASVRFVFREMPIVKLYPQSINIAEGALCAKDQGKYLEYSEYAFIHQAEASADFPEKIARDIGLDSAQFGLCYSQKFRHQQIVNDLYDAQSLGLTGTPTFFINNERIVGAAMFSELKNAIDLELRK
ncbi:MAG: thioredoxin domain-containing protein [Patescibacteria group bacterium]